MSGNFSTPPFTGLIATLRRGDEVMTRHFDGRTTLEALTRLVARCDAEGWRVQTISTPPTIFRDCVASREYRRGGAAGRDDARDGYGLAMPEESLLNHVGRADLCR